VFILLFQYPITTIDEFTVKKVLFFVVAVVKACSRGKDIYIYIYMMEDKLCACH
jgi:hypothetical protein